MTQWLVHRLLELEIRGKALDALALFCTMMAHDMFATFFIIPTAESWYPGILDTEILWVKDTFCRDFSGVLKKIQVFDSQILLNLKFLITKCHFFSKYK